MVDPERFEAFSGTVSLPFPAGQAQARRGEGDRPARQRGHAGPSRWRASRRWPGCRTPAQRATAHPAGREPDPLQPVRRAARTTGSTTRRPATASHAGTRRPASYWYKTEQHRQRAAELSGFAEEERDDLPLVNLLREDVQALARARTTEAPPKVTKDLLRHWARPDRRRRLFFCQREAVETIIYLLELRIPANGRAARFKPALSDDDLARCSRASGPAFSSPTRSSSHARSTRRPNDGLAPLRRLAARWPPAAARPSSWRC